ncbi:hypothetical protein [Mesorhizobium ventifaucium]|uniref:hypothetical protein n=1 Tax=Mesorhizobium ventifaucium TaxID=666020 RepID=UPI0020A7AD21|nr:hypothetical protein [Mesorhizobium ventifaucium]
MSDSHAVDTPSLQTLFQNAVKGRYGIRLAFRDKERANSAVALLSPSYVLHGPQETTHLVW